MGTFFYARPRSLVVGSMVVGITSLLGLVIGAPAQAAPCSVIELGPGLAFGDNILRGRSITVGSVTLAHQDDGNVVVYEDGDPVWATGTDSRGTTDFVVQGDGNVVLYNGSGVVWNSNTDSEGVFFLVLSSECPIERSPVSRRTPWIGLARPLDGRRFLQNQLLRWYLP